MFSKVFYFYRTHKPMILYPNGFLFHKMQNNPISLINEMIQTQIRNKQSKTHQDLNSLTFKINQIQNSYYNNLSCLTEINQVCN